MLPLWVEFFEDLQNVRGRTNNTVMAYRHDLELYESYAQGKKSVSEFYDFMRIQKLSVRSQARVISSLRTYFKFCETRGYPSSELVELRCPRVQTSLPKPLSQDEFQKLFSASTTEIPERTARNQMTLMLLYGLGCRVSELIQVDLNDYHEAERWLKILGKGNKERLVPLTEHLNVNLTHYIREYRESLLRDEKTASLLINDRGNRPSRVDVWRWLAAWSEKAGFDEPVGPHRFRHGCATSLLESGADLRSIQKILGHSSIQTTQIYTQVTTQNLIKTVDEYHPLAEVEGV